MREASGVEVITELGLESQIEVSRKSEGRSSGKREKIFRKCGHV